jgi:branched-subunit amino acid transport protein
VSDPWRLVALVGAGTILLRGIAPAVLAGRRLGPRAMATIELLPPALLSALVATQAFSTRGTLVVDERAFGLVAATVALLLRAPLLLVIAAAAVTTAVARIA